MAQRTLFISGVSCGFGLRMTDCVTGPGAGVANI
jgi:hypothetical protein